MNIKFSKGALRCRVSKAELDLLMVGRAIVLEVTLPRNHTFRLSVRPDAIAPWQLESDPTGLWLTIPRRELEALSKSLPSRDGIEHSFEVAHDQSIAVSFEVDVQEGT